MLKDLGRFILAGILILVAGVVFSVIYDAGTFDKVWEHPASACRSLKGVMGVEDMVRVPGTRQIIFSANDRAHLRPESANGLYLYDLEQPSVAPQLLTALTAVPWSPQGIGIWTDGPDVRIFAINHQHPHDRVEILDFRNGQLLPVRSVEFPGITTLNAVLPLDGESFFASQDLGSQNYFMQLVEKYLRRPWSKIWLHSAGQNQVAAESILFANGLALAPDTRTLYVASMLDRSLLVFRHEAATHALSDRRSIFLDTAPDNLRWSEESPARLLIGAQPKLLELAAHLGDPRQRRSPSQLLAVAGLPDQPQISEIHSSKGADLSAVSTGLQVDRELVMGGVIDEGLLICAMPAWGIQP